MIHLGPAFASDYLVQKDLPNSTDITTQIENAFLFSKKERGAIYHDTMKIRGHKSFVNEPNDDIDRGFAIKSFDSMQEVNLNKKAKEKVAYNSFISGQYEIALKMYRDLAIEYNDDYYIQYSLALTYQTLRQFEQAKSIYFKLLKEKIENNQEITANLLHILSEENPSNALLLLTKLSNQNPKSGYFMSQKAVILEKMGNYDEAIVEMKKATMIEPDRADYRLNLAIMHDKNENFIKALENYRLAVKNSYSRDDNSNIPVEQILSRIEIVKTLI
tara:strand:- start:4209 stop:5030 length:822 start_codon:yes stop_codon:yes gene_type:complete